MKCKKCGAELVIDEWNGWVWACFNCDTIWRRATLREVKKNENIKNNNI